MRDATATRQRIVTAATAEFAAHGIAGARVDRIASAASTNKAQLYAYFGNKDALFDAIFERRVLANKDEVPFTPDDLPGYAVRLYDAYLADPDLVRLVTWARLERTPTGNLFGHLGEGDAEKLAGIERAQAEGSAVDDLPATDLWAMLIALASTWAQSSIVWAASETDPKAHHTRRRKALRATVERAFCPTRPAGRARGR